MTRKRKTAGRRAFGASLAFALAMSISNVASAAWPIPPSWTYLLEQVPYGGNTVCIRAWRGTWGSSSTFFSQTHLRVNYGGTCNVNWTRPAGEIEARSRMFSSSTTVHASSGWQANAQDSYYAHSQVNRRSNSIKVRYDFGATYQQSGAGVFQYVDISI